MHLEQITLHNLRRFGQLTVELHPRLTVLAGVNGAGKSSLLEGLTIAVGGWLLGFDDVMAPSIHPDQVRVVQHEAHGQVTIEPQYPVEVSARGWLGESIEWSRSLSARKGRTTYGQASAIKERAESAQRAVKAGEAVDLPVLACYGAGRLWVQKNASEKKSAQLGSRTLAYVDCMEPASNQKLFEAWMRRMEGARIQQIAEHAARGGLPADVIRPPVLDAVERAAAAMVPDAERLYFDVAHDELRLLYADGRRLPFRMLSDGYRNLIATVADIAWRAVQLNPHQGAAAIERARGVVLIDEVELHLHPSWQRVVLERLARAFPGLQFVVTTHAPVVIASTPPESLRFLDGAGGVHRVDVARGLTANVVLRELMGVPERPDREARQLAELGALIEAGEVEKARDVFDALNAQFGGIDPDLAVLEWELRDLEVNGEMD
ncbi:MAG: AAA family ATPase [bacterium]